MAGSVGIEVGRTVRAELARRGRSQQWLGERLGVSQANVSRRLLGKTPFDVEELVAIAGAFDMDVHDLLPRPQEAAA